MTKRGDKMNQDIKNMLLGVFLLQIGHLCMEVTNTFLVPVGLILVIVSIVVVLTNFRNHNS